MGVLRILAVYIAMTFLLSRSRKFPRYPEARWTNCAFGTIQASVALLVLLSLVHPSRTFAASPDLETVLTGQRQRIEKLDYRVTGRLTRVEGNGKRTSYKFAAKAHWFPDGLRLLCEISGPASEKTSLLVQMSVTGHMTVEAVFPGEKAARVLPFERWNDPLMGTDFSIEDMVESQFFWKNQELLASEKYGARDCFVLKSMPGPQDRTYYGSVTSWIDRTILFPVHVVKTLRGTGQQKEFVYYGLRQVGDGLRRKWRRSCRVSPAPRFLQSNLARERQILDARTLILASPAFRERKRNKSNRLGSREAMRRHWSIHGVGHHGTSSFSDVAVAPRKPKGHQFQSPASCNSAGPTIIRTTVASMNTATASVKPSIWTTRKLPTVNAVKTAIIIAAALVMSPAVRAKPSITADLSDRPRRRSSRTRATRNTS
jgi:hypothetical protein